MLKTGASLVVAAVGSAEVGEEGYYPNIDAQQIASRRSSTTNGRKRKRRPQASTSEDDNAEYDSKQYWRGHVDDDVIHKAGNAKDVNVNTKTRRRKQPAIREPLAALEKEQKLYEMRDRQRQENEEIDGTKSHDKSYRRPYAQAKKEFYNSTPTSIGIDLAESKTATDLKHILKNSGGLSLSEILQQKNLSLDDLLKGKQNALLALQTTAASPNISAGDASASTHQKAENFNHLKPARRIPTTYLGDRSSEVNADSGERVSSEDTPAGKNKLKFPALQRLKLFGTSSRVTAIPLPGSGEVVTKKRIPSGSTTSTTSTITTTSRLPIYKKRTQQRPTLKPPGLFKATISTTPQAAQATKEMPTSKEISTTTKSIEEAEPVEIIDTLKEKHNDNVKLQVKELEDNMSAEQSENYDATTEHNSVNITTPTEVATASTILQTSVSSTTTSTTAAATTTATVNSSSRRHKFAANPRQRVKSKFRERINGNNLKSNFIEQNEAQLIQTNSEHSNESKETIKNSFEEDDLENFFEEVSKEAKLEAEEMQTTIESITARIDRTRNNKESNSLSPFLSSSKITTSSEESLPDFDGIDDRTDLLELIEDRRSGNRLFKILQQRNMTLDELIEHRKRGSSQLHLATIVEQNARSQFFPGQKVVLHDNMDIVTAFENFPHFNLLNIKSVKPDDIKTDSQGSSYFTSIIDIEPTDDAFKKIGADIIDGVGDGNLRGPMYSQPKSERTDKSLSFFPSWKTLALASLTSTTKSNPFFLPASKLLLDEPNSNEFNEENLVISNETSASNEQQQRKIDKTTSNSGMNAEQTAEAIENEVARAHDLLDLELSGHAFKRSPAAASMIKQQYNGAASLYANMPTGVRSVIVACAAIVLTSLATFLVIFIVCRLKQRKRSNTNYLRSYNSIKKKIPTTEKGAATTTTTTLGKISSTSATNSRQSSLRNNSIENILAGSGGTNNANDDQHVNVSTITTRANQQQQMLQRSTDLLFPRRDSLISGNAKTNQKHNIKTCTTGFLCSRKESNRSRCNVNFSAYNGGFSSATGLTNSLALSLRSAHNISSTKLNSMDPNSPEVQEYLFDTLRNSFN